VIENQQKIPSLFKLGASLLYEFLALIALAFFSVSIFYVLLGDATAGYKRVLLQLFIWLLIGAYFVRSWMVRGQTLAMRSWKLKLVDEEAHNISLKKAALRYLLSSLNLAFFGLGFLYCFFDGQRRFLHDKLLNINIVDVSPKK
jgi:uncharacterized RDD family membrane protein YckC